MCKSKYRHCVDENEKIYCIVNSLIPCVLLYALHDFCSFISAEGSMQSDMISGAVQFIILLAYFLYMLHQRRWERKDTL